MCGILAVLGVADNSQAKRSRIIELSRRLRHRGPDWSGLHHHGDCYLAHQRLAIVDPASGDQPLYNEDKTVVVTVNGEIYNHKELREKLKSHEFRTGSDCEVIAHLYEEYGEEFVNMLDGMFSFVLLDTRDNSFIAARDAIGITPLYVGWGLDGSTWFSSEMKALSDDCERFMSFLPGHIYSSKNGGLRRWYNPTWYAETIPSGPYDPLVLRRAFEKAVIKRLMTDVPFGVLLSGGLDSSLVASVASRYLAGSAAAQWGSQLHTFCVGLKGSPDLRAAKEVADYLGTRHHEFHFTVQEGIDALEEVIYHTETYDVTTIRASTPMFLMSRKIKSLGVKMVLSGEGSDEIFGGYLYFHKAPNKEEFHKETCRKIKALHLYDCLRANKSTSAWGLEARVPFLDKEFINVAMGIDPEWKMIRPDLGRIEKWIIRNAFDDEQTPYLPKHILYRQKEQFSDGVGYSWIDGLKEHADQQVTDAMLAKASFVYPENTPTTKEAYYYRTIFERFFPKNSARSTVPGGPSIACSTAKAVEWDAAWSKNLDPSGRAALGVHLSAYDEGKTAAEAPLINGASSKE
ncbi:asparagine synthetase 3 [Perilla frutescens var. hirtella]|uniref:Asparagine synthetase [glutamine-hydrolyzing] n=1 Tax=Perilla frutescens var. hirtella TaxID=608512 RepID=A0AAD4IVQ9_PERFH|nr:asparagine synthetase 3 [Perilla frutescens var. hirtella]KAH6808160.1 asparagine synthetase 3 [Perilla frutescens var. frutescens]KAH6821976.1 asparagine synthetase 3 [Perilla frutescens var. hirtella]